MSFYERDADGKLVPIGEVPDAAIVAIERFDEEAIAHRLTTGIATDAFIYHYPIKTATGVKEIVGISTDGADEIARMLGNLEILPDIRVDKDSDPDYIYVMVRAKDLIRNVTLLGTGRSCKYQMGRGNQPDHDRLNEWCFVSSVSKAQRNAILRHTPEEVIVKIINLWSQKGKSKTLRPPPLETEPESRGATPASAPIVTPAPTQSPALAPATTSAPTATQATEQLEKLKKLRMEVHNRFQTDLGIGLEKRKTMLKQKFGVDSLTDLSEQQLNVCKAWVEEMIDERTQAPTSKPVTAPETRVTQAQLHSIQFGELGFESADEQNRLRGILYSMLTNPNQLNLKPEEARKFITDKGFTSSADVPKVRLLEMIKEAEGLIEIKQMPSPPEGEPGTDAILF